LISALVAESYMCTVTAFPSLNVGGIATDDYEEEPETQRRTEQA
jgi:hypothetical protein